MTGYPVITDPDHPLYAAAQDGWPDHTPEQAMTEAVRVQRSGFADSLDHPAFDPKRFINPLATRPEDDEPAPEPQAARR